MNYHDSKQAFTNIRPSLRYSISLTLPLQCHSLPAGSGLAGLGEQAGLDLLGESWVLELDLPVALAPPSVFAAAVVPARLFLLQRKNRISGYQKYNVSLSLLVIQSGVINCLCIVQAFPVKDILNVDC